MVRAFGVHKAKRFLWRWEGAALAVVLCAGTLRFRVDYWIVLGLLLFFVLLPGLALLGLIFRELDWDWAERIGAGFALGLVLDAAFFFVLSRTAPEVRPEISFVLLSSLVAGLTAWAWGARRIVPQPVGGGAPPRLLVSGACALSALLLFNENALLLTSDALAYIPRIQEWAELGRFGERIAGGPVAVLGRTRMYRTAIEPFFLRIGGADPVHQYLILASLMAPFFLCSFYAFTRKLHARASLVTWSLGLCLLHFGGIWFNWIHANYSWFPAWQVWLVGAAFLLDGTRNGAAGKGMTGLVLLGSTWLIHGSLFMVSLVSAASFAWAWILAERRRGGGIRLAAWVSILVPAATYLVYAADVLGWRFPALDAWSLYRHGGRIYGLLRPWDAGYVVNMASLPLKFLGLWGLLAVPLPLLFRSRLAGGVDRWGRIFLLSNLYVPLLVMLNPLLVTALVTLGGGEWMSLERLCFVLPYISVSAWLADGWIPSLPRAKAGGKERMKCVLLVLLLAVTGFSVCTYRFLLLLPSDWGYRVQPVVLPLTGLSRGPFRYDQPALRNCFLFIRHRTAPSARFVTDPLTAELFPVHLPRRFVLERWRSSLMGSDIVKSVSMKILGPGSSLERTLSDLKRFRIEYVLVNDSMDPAMKFKYFGKYLHTGVHVFGVEKFRTHYRLFRLLYERGGVYLFRVRAVSPPPRRGG